MTGDFSCVAKPGYEDITQGATVELLDTQGGVIATSQLGTGSSDSKIRNPTMGDPCIFEFSLANVAISQATYSIRVGKPDRTPIPFTAEDLNRGPLVFVDGKR
ncbi:hypothetical protein [Subtercola boreus]|uniref:hypothetical protein n=1 Tax=Subtercola boreus TaxID=120213 RepID=UPI0011C07AE6|nr:hypothetical protein [Subtercola boreus]